jgi:branched-chain amino acid transport system substrate-binding protein
MIQDGGQTMPENRPAAISFLKESAMTHRIALLVGAMLLGLAANAQAAGDITIVRDLASRVGPVIGSAQACRDIARPRIQAITDKFSQVIREAS